MSASNPKKPACYAALLLLCGSGVVQAATLFVHCGASTGLATVGAALKALKYSESSGPSTINVSGTCNENVLVQNLDRLTLNGASPAWAPRHCLGSLCPAERFKTITLVSMRKTAVGCGQSAY